MSETSIPVQRISLNKVAEDLNPTIEKSETEDQKIAQLSKQVGWEALKSRLEQKMRAIDESAKTSSQTLGAIDNFENFGFRSAARDLLIEAYQGVINEVEMTAHFLQGKKDEEAKRDNRGDTRGGGK